MKVTNIKLSDVKKAFDAVPKIGRDDRFGGSVLADGDFNTHIQGLAAYGDFHLLTHSDRGSSRKSGRLLIANRKRDVQALAGEFSLPVVSDSLPFYFHPGGCQLIGDCLAVPVETGEGHSIVQFFDVSDPLDVHELDPASRVKRDKDAGAVGITNFTRSETEVWLLCVYDNGATDFYQSIDKNFAGGFQLLFSVVPPLKETEHQALCLLTDTSNRVFAVGLNKTFSGLDVAVLYGVDLENRQVNMIEERTFQTKGPLPRAHLRWGASVEIVSGSELAMYCTGRRYDAGCHINGFDSLAPSRRRAATKRPVKKPSPRRNKPAEK
jgi:hypothetical protein